MKTKYITFFLLMSISLIPTSCNRFLDEKSDLKLAIPSTLEENQALLDRYSDLITNFAASGMTCSDDYYITDSNFNALMYEEDKRLYTWQPDHVATSKSIGNDWLYCYKAIYIANSVVYNLDTYHIPNSENVRGQALVFRAARYLDGAQIWCLAYNKNTANTDLGLPLRLDPDTSIPSVRSSVQDTYNQILKDLNESLDLLPVKQLATTRPSKITALAYLARTYLYMGDYENALNYATRALSLQNALMDFNTLNPADSFPIKDQNKEVLLRASMYINLAVYSPIIRVPQNIYDSYASNDLRKSIYFKINTEGEITFRGNYTGGSSGKLVGVTIDELYLIAAESNAQLNKVPEAMNTLNQLLVTRWKNGTFINLTATTKDGALSVIAIERQKELLFRGTRWADLKRYNRDGANIALTKIVNGETYNLPPNDLRYAITIPEEIISLSGIQQNIR